MSRLTGNDAYGLMEAYSAVYQPRLELTEEQVWEEVEEWVNALIEEGYDLSDYTWEEMYEAYIEEARAEGVKPYKPQPLKPLPQAEEVDVYDVILSHLLDEGYASSVDAAEAIMVNMSEDWRDIIIEEILDEANGRAQRRSLDVAARRRYRLCSGQTGREACGQATLRNTCKPQLALCEWATGLF